ncbi:MAG: acVLRF1 family peptidyl-tRNA hydrolase [Stackebrandtia sp.]
MDGFDSRHRVTDAALGLSGLHVTADDGSTADCELPLWGGGPATPPSGDSRDLIEAFAELASKPYRVGVLLARRRGFAVGIFAGDKLTESKVDSSYVQSRTAAGGWSQQRYARRRGNQAAHAAGKAADVVHRILAENLPTLSAVVTAGDKEAVSAILADPRLSALSDKLAPPHIGNVGEPKLATLKELPKKFWSVRIHLTEPVEDSAG